MNQIAKTGSDEWAEGWKIILASFVGISLCLSPLPYYSLNVLSPELNTQFGWDRAQTAGGYMCMTIGVLIGAPFVGYLTDRFGPRRVVLPSIIILGLGMASFSMMNGNIWIFYGIFTLMAVLSVGTLPITWTKAINNGFDKTKGIALGVALMGTGLFGFLAPAYVQWLIDGWGWRAAYIGLGVLPILLAFPLAFFFFHDPVSENAPVHKEKEREEKTDTTLLPGMKMAAIARDYRFYILLLSFLVLGAAVSGILANSVFILLDKGYTPKAATGYFTGVGIAGLAVLAGRPLGGWLLDRFWAPGVAFVFMIVPALSCYILMQNDASIWMNALALAIAGIAAGVEYDMMAFMVSRYFGMKSYGRVYGIIYASFGLGSGASPYVYNKIQIATGSYDLILTIAAVGFVLGASVLLFLGKYREFNDDGQQISV